MIPLIFQVYASLSVIANGPTKDARYMPDFLPGQAIRQRLDFPNLSKSPAPQLPTPCRVDKLHSAGGSNNFWRLAAGGVVLPKMDPPDRAGVKASKAVLGIVMSVSTRSSGTVFAENV